MHSSEPKYWIELAKGTLGLGAHITNARLHVLDLMVQEAYEQVPVYWNLTDYEVVRDHLRVMIYLLGFAKKEHIVAREKQPMIWMFIGQCTRLIEELPVYTHPIATEEPSEPKYVPTVGEIPF